MTKGKVSVVVPIYNVEKYLDRCILSIVNQTYTNIEIILVDDGSPDNCPIMCDEWAKRDGRIKVVHKLNAGLGFARNTGIENATGEYICFFDSDDYIEPTTIEECYCLAKGEKADIVCFGNDKVTQEGKVIEMRIPAPPKNVFSGAEVIDCLLPMTLSYNVNTGENWNLSLSAWCGMFSMDVVKKNEWRFVSEREIISEDYYSVLNFYKYVKKAVIINKIFYHYVFNPVSLSQTFREDRYRKIKYFSYAITELSDNMGCNTVLKDRIAMTFLGFTIGALKQIVASKNSICFKRRELKKIVNDEYCQHILWENDFPYDTLPKRVLYWAMKNRVICLCYFIVGVRNLKE